MNVRAFLIFGAFLITLLSGCKSRTFSGGLTYLNFSKKEIWVDRTEGVKREYGVGIMIPQAEHGIVGYVSRVPQEITIHWSYKYASSDQTTTLRIVPPPSNQSELQVIFTDTEEWTSKWKEK